MRLLTIGVSVAVSLSACGARDEAVVADAWIRLPAVPGRPGAAYFHLRGGGRAATLVAVTTPLAARAELHESMTGHAGMMRMAPLATVAVGPHADVAFAPGGRHVMLFDLAPAARAGTTARLAIRFADGRTVTTDARVLAAGDPAPPR